MELVNRSCPPPIMVLPSLGHFQGRRRRRRFPRDNKAAASLDHQSSIRVGISKSGKLPDSGQAGKRKAATFGRGFLKAVEGFGCQALAASVAVVSGAAHVR